MPIGNQLMRARAGTYNLIGKILKPKIFSSNKNNSYNVLCLSKIMAYLVLMLHCLLSLCLVTYIFNKLLFLYAATAYIGKSCNVLLFINDYFCNLPLWYCYYLDRVMLKQTLVQKNRQLSNFVIGA